MIMINRIRQFLKLEHIRLLSGSVAIQIVGYSISLLLTPIAIAFYTPADFGVFAVALFVANFVGSFGAMKLEWAVINERSNRVADYLIRFATVLLGASCLVALLLLLAAPNSIYSHFEIDRTVALWAVPIAMATGFGILQQAWGIRAKAYREVYFSRNSVMISRQILQIFFGYISPSILGLLSSEVLSRLLGIQFLLVRINRYVLILPIQKFIRSLRPLLLRRYRHYTSAALPSSLLTYLLTQSLPVILLPMYGAEAAGAFWLVQRIFGIPVAMIGTVAADVFQGQIARRTDQDAVRLHMIHITGLLGLFAFLLMPAGAVLFWLLTQHFYDGKWILSGQIAIYILPAMAIQFVASPISRILIVREKMHFKLIFDFLLLSMVIFWVFSTYYFNMSIFSSIILITAFQSLAYSMYIFISFYVAYTTL